MAGVELSETTVQKFDEPGLIAVEAEKMVRASQIGMATGHFVVPEVLECDKERGRLIMRRIVDYRPLREAAFARNERLDFYLRLGKALRATHDHLKLPAEMQYPVPGVLEGPGPCGFLHGDMSTVNVGVSEGELVILDWQLTRIYGGRATYGPVYFDCAWLLNNIFSRPLYRCAGWDPEEDAEAFVLGYFGETPDENFYRYQLNFVSLTIARRQRDSWLKSWLLRYAHRRWRAYVCRGKM